MLQVKQDKNQHPEKFKAYVVSNGNNKARGLDFLFMYASDVDMIFFISQ